MLITGRVVNAGDHLYHIGLQAWLQVQTFDSSGSAIARVLGGQVQRDFIITAGGLINNRRVIYWHAPLVLDLPTSNITKYQNVLNALINEFGA